MSIVADSHSLDLSQPGFVHIEYRSLRYRSLRDTSAGQFNKVSQLWFERQHLRWVLESLHECLTSADYPSLSTEFGQDALKVYLSGPEQAPYINLENERPVGVPHGGYYWFAMSAALGRTLAAELSSLV